MKPTLLMLIVILSASMLPGILAAPGLSWLCQHFPCTQRPICVPAADCSHQAIIQDTYKSAKASLLKDLCSVYDCKEYPLCNPADDCPNEVKEQGTAARYGLTDRADNYKKVLYGLKPKITCDISFEDDAGNTFDHHQIKKGFNSLTKELEELVSKE